jgi:CHAT domain-containing protein/tetratricopeptide (TPR) repeat protein
MSVRDRIASSLEKISRPPVVRVTFAVAALGLFSCTPQSDSDLATQFAADQRITGDMPSLVAFDLEPGQYLVEARERDIDVRLIVEAGGKRAEYEDNVPRHGLHATVVSLTEPGPLRLELRNSEHRGKHGAVRLRVARWRRDADDEPGARERAFAAFGNAGIQTHLGTKESWTRAADLLHEAIAQFGEARDDESRAQTEYTLAHLEYLRRMEWQPAIRAAQRAGEIYRDLDDRTGEFNASSLRAVAELEVAAGMSAGTQRAEQRALYAAADASLAKAAEYFTEREMNLRAEYAVNMRGIRAFYEGSYEEAAGFFQRAVDLSRLARDPGEESRALANLAFMHYSLGRVTQAADEYERLLPLIEKDRQPDVYASMVGNYGIALVALGDFDKAVALHTEALGIAARLHNDPERARHLEALGALYVRTGDMRRALETLRAALEIYERNGDAIARASTLRMAGNAASALDQHDQALDYLRKSVEIDVNPHSSARTRVLIASELRVLGDLRGAESELQQALESTNALVRANVLDQRGRLRIAQKRYADAIEDLRAADRQFVALSLDFNRIDTNTALAQALLARREVEPAREAAETAVSIVRRIRVKSGNPEWRAHFLSTRYSPYEMRIAVDFAAGDTPAASWHAFRTAEEVRARSLSDQLAGGAQRRGAAPDPEGDALRAQLTSQQLQLESGMQKQDVVEKDVAELRRAIVETRARIDAHRLRTGAVAAGEAEFTESLADLQSRLPADTAVLAYFVGDEASHAWLLTRRELRHVALRGRTTLQRVTDGFVAARRLGTSVVAEREVGAQLLGNLLAGVSENRLLIIPDGPLNGIPFAAVAIPGGPDYMIDRFVIGYAPSLALALDGVPRRSAQPATRVAVVSDPVYAPDDQRLVLAGGPGGTLRGPPPAASPNKLTRLPYSSLEARAVAKALGAKDTLQLEGFDANISRVLGLAEQELSVLHFATHAIARRDLPEQSALYLTEYSPEGKLLSNTRLTASEIARTGLHAEVVVLSGCGTGDGSELRGEGVLGLTYGFLANGSRSVVAALWPIEDASTARFMNEFYRAYRETGKTADSLRTAQLRTRDSAKTAVWSSFVVRANGFP